MDAEEMKKYEEAVRDVIGMHAIVLGRGGAGYVEFDAWLAAHDAEVQAQVVAEEPEWEYTRQAEASMLNDRGRDQGRRDLMSVQNEKLIEEAHATMRRQEWAPAGLLIRLADALEAAEKQVKMIADAIRDGEI
jgi:hypothetical protein